MAAASVKLTPISYIKFTANSIEADGLFMSCTLPSGTIRADVKHFYAQNGGNDKAHLPVQVDWSPISLVRGIDDKKGCYTWFEKIAAEGPEGNTTDATLQLLSHKQQPVMVWSLEGAWISSYQAAASEAGGNGTAIETIEITYKNAKRTQ